MDKRFCPKCGSTNVEPDHRKTNMLGEIIADQNKWLCNNCNYTGIMPKGDPENQEEAIEQMEFEPASQPAIDTDLGKGYAKYILYVTAPLMIVYLIVILL
jgi:predicted nucleic-acid-binding Zn-ribbon protein